MITSNINSPELSLYAKLNPYFAKAFEDIKKIVADNQEVGKYVIEEDKYFYMVQEYEAKTVENSKFEMHEEFIDIQYIISGCEEIRFDKPERLKPGIEPKGDNVFFTMETDTYDTAVLTAGDFSIIFPGEPHAPGIRHSEEGKAIRKIVFKIKY